MTGLDVGVGRALEAELCFSCRERLRRSLGKSDIAFAVTPRGLKRLFRKIGDNVCSDCAQVIYAAGGRV